MYCYVPDNVVDKCKIQNHSVWLLLRMFKKMPGYSLQSEPWVLQGRKVDVVSLTFFSLLTLKHIGSAIHGVCVNLDVHIIWHLRN
jgi:hypothetical protein